MAFETLHGAQKEISSGLEFAFVSTVHGRIFDSYAESMADAGFSSEEEQEFREELGTLRAGQVNGLLSLPFELRAVRLRKMCEHVRRGELTIRSIVHRLASEAVERGYTLGYHMSNADIVPRKGRNGQEHWVIDGREQDHRDADLPMAYYSTDLANLYGAKRARFLYIVRAETGAGTTHRQDNDCSWGRAPKLDVVEKLDYESVMRDVRRKVRENGNGRP